MRQLLVEQMAQPAELIGIAQFVGFDNFVGGRAECLVHRVLVRAAARQLPRPAGATGVVVAGARHHLALGVGVAVLLGIRLRAVARRAIHRRLSTGAGALAAFVFVFALGFLAFALAVLG